MRFGTVPLSEAEGTILAHSARLTGRALKKGHVLSADDIELFKDDGIELVTVAQLDPDDIDENSAAAQITRALAGVNVRPAKAFTGRCNLIAEKHGLITFDVDILNEINLVDEAITVATIAAYDITSPNQLIATIKIIPFAVSKSILTKVLGVIGSTPPISVAPFGTKKIGLIMTRLPGMKESILDKTLKVSAERVADFNCEIAEEIRCEHAEEEVIDAIKILQANSCDIILIFGASAVVDRADILPASVVKSGGTVDHFGMPVDPGNLMFLGHIGSIPVVGMPGCARSPKLNGFDWILWRLLSDLEVTPRDIMLMGSGGLLKEISERGQLRQADDASINIAREPMVTALLLAAGSSRRMGTENKLLSDLDGTPMVARVAAEIKASQASGLLVVTGHEANEVETALKDYTSDFTHNPDYKEGLSTSLKAGLAALISNDEIDWDGVIVCLGDMPLLKAEHINLLIRAFDPVEGRSICVPVHGRKRGNPVIWGKQYISEILAITGDIGARHLLETHADQVIEVPIDQDAVIFDVDTPERLAELKNRNPS